MPPPKYKHIFFDLDHTIWDFEKNSKETLTELYEDFHMSDRGISSLEFFIKTYLNRTQIMWEQFRDEKIDRETLRDKRFEFTLLELGIVDEKLAVTLSYEYILRNHHKTNLFPNAHEVLSYLKDKYILHIITNGFMEVQLTKMDSNNLTNYFSEIIISEQTGFKKPDPHIFHHSLKQAGATAQESLMIGDSLESDIAGARSVGMDQVYFNPKKTSHNEQITYEINSLIELKNFL